MLPRIYPQVLKLAHDLKPWRMAGCRGARAVLELPAGEAWSSFDRALSGSAYFGQRAAA